MKATTEAVWSETPSRIVGIDLAWGTKNPDGIAEIRFEPSGPAAVLSCVGRSTGDAAFLQFTTPGPEPTLLAIDAPIVCVNETGSRPVDRLTHRHFGRFHAGCHPASLAFTSRPPALLQQLREQGYRPGWALAESTRLALEVYPHPAMIRWFDLPRVLKYKRSPVANRRSEFQRYQNLFRDFLDRELPWLDIRKGISLFEEPWKKGSEDQLDALFCAVIGLWHVAHLGSQTQILGDTATGFLAVPQIAAREVSPD